MTTKRKVKQKGLSESVRRPLKPRKVMPTFVALAIGLLCAIAAVSWSLWMHARKGVVALPLPSTRGAPLANIGRLNVASLQVILDISSKDLQRIDIAVMNLLAAESQ